MKLNIGFIKSEGQFLLKELDTDNSSVESKILDTVDIKESPMNLMFFGGENAPEGLQKTILDENKFYPILSADTLGLSTDSFESLSFEELSDLYAKVNARWILNNNVKTIEQVYSVITYLRDMWSSDRNAFFEELWFLIKTNLATSDLTIVFHDVKETDPEKGEKPSLIYSFAHGKKAPQIFEGGEREAAIMKEYDKDFSENFEITEFDSSKGNLVATVKIGLSPILIMAKLKTFNQLQRSILIALFSGLQDS